MILSSVDIKEYLANNKLTIEPAPTAEQIDTTTIDLRIGSPLWEWNPALLDQGGMATTIDVDNYNYKTSASPYMRKIEIIDGQYIIKPKTFYLGQTHEKVKFPVGSKIAARVEGKSRLARLGLVIHMTAPTIHCGYGLGIITLEIYNFGPYKLALTPEKTAICQLIIELVNTEPPERVGRTFQNSKSVQG